MKQARGNLFHMVCDALCVTTNGFVKSNGQCVMGKGCAKALADALPHIPEQLGSLIRQNGNVCQIIQESVPVVLAFPVKPVFVTSTGNNVVAHMASRMPVGSFVPGWASVAQLTIIKQSAYELEALATKHGWTNVLLPRPGCGAGELDWSDVEPILSSILDDRFTAVTF